MKSPLPDKYFTKLYFTHYYKTVNANSAGIVDWVFRGNGAYDPDESLGGYGCNGFTELAAIYSSYKVYSSKITVTAKSVADTTDLGDSTMVVVPDRSSSDYTMSLFNDRVGMPETKSRMLNRYTNGKSPTTITSYRRTKDIWGEDELDDDQYKSATNDLPGQEWFWHVMFARSDGSAIGQSPSVIFSVKIVYYIEFSTRKALSAPAI